MAVAAGVILAGKYQLISEIGRGGMGSVWSARRLDLDASVAIKIMHGEAAAKPGALERFRREAKSAAALRGPHVVQVLDYGVDEPSGVAFICMELLEGESLRQRLERDGRLAPHRVAEIVSQVARGLMRAHAAGIVHRDLKPENVFIVKNEDAELVKLLDFGIAKADTQSGQFFTVTGAVIGTPHYMSPEQIESSRRVDALTDVWSLGVIAAECLVGVRPFDADTMQELAMKICLGRPRLPSSVAPVPLGFDTWFEKACDVKPERRFQSAGELARELVAVCASAPAGSAADRVIDLGATARIDSFGGMGDVARSADVASRSLARRLSPRAWLAAGVALAMVVALVLVVSFGPARGARRRSGAPVEAPVTTRVTATALPLPPAGEALPPPAEAPRAAVAEVPTAAAALSTAALPAAALPAEVPPAEAQPGERPRTSEPAREFPAAPASRPAPPAGAPPSSRAARARPATPQRSTAPPPPPRQGPRAPPANAAVDPFDVQ